MNGCLGSKRDSGSVRTASTKIGIKKSLLTQERVRSLFDYNPETGELVRRVSTSNRVKVGDVAGYLQPDGYLTTWIDGRGYLNHRLIWLHVHGYFPEHGIDHINRVRSDNRIENLREASQSCNIRNSCQQSNNTSGVQGVGWYRQTQKWQARIYVDKKSHHLGLHSSFLEAVCHRLAAEQCLNWSSCDSNSPAYQHVHQRT